MTVRLLKAPEKTNVKRCSQELDILHEAHYQRDRTYLLQRKKKRRPNKTMIGMVDYSKGNKRKIKKIAFEEERLQQLYE